MEITQRGEKSLSDLKKAFAGESNGTPDYDPGPREPNLGWSDGLGRNADNPKEPKTTGWKITVGNEQYTASSCETRIKAQFEDKVKGEALRAIKEIRDTLGPDAADRAQDKFVAERSEGFYNLDGRHCLAALMEFSSTSYFLYLLLRRCHPEMTEDRARNIFVAERKQCITAVRWALGNWIGSIPDGESSGTESPSTEMMKKAEKIWDAAQRGEKTSPTDLDR